jgi:hypothetical protein
LMPYSCNRIIGIWQPTEEKRMLYAVITLGRKTIEGRSGTKYKFSDPRADNEMREVDVPLLLDALAKQVGYTRSLRNKYKITDGTDGGFVNLIRLLRITLDLDIRAARYLADALMDEKSFKYEEHEIQVVEAA